jgi:hypothetical protein
MNSNCDRYCYSMTNCCKTRSFDRSTKNPNCTKMNFFHSMNSKRFLLCPKRNSARSKHHCRMRSSCVRSMSSMSRSKCRPYPKSLYARYQNNFR